MATTPDGRSIDRAFLTDDLVATGATVTPVRGADHFVCTFRISRRWLGPEHTGRSLHRDTTRATDTARPDHPRLHRNRPEGPAR